MMKFFVAGALCTLSTAGFAADLPSRQAPPLLAPPVAINWEGVYLGMQSGFAWGSSSNYIVGFGGTQGSNPNGAIAGAHLGYNHQISQIVLGIEGDVDGATYSKYPVDGITGTGLGISIPVEGSVRGRLGVAYERVLLYITGGAAIAELQHEYAGGVVGGGPYNVNGTRLGWTAGVGAQYAFHKNWSVRAEYRYSDFGHETDGILGALIFHHETQHAARLGVTYKFDMYAPPPVVVAKY